jgi:hypothetical protein
MKKIRLLELLLKIFFIVKNFDAEICDCFLMNYLKRLDSNN